MAKSPLSPESRASFAAKIAAGKKAENDQKALEMGLKKGGGRSWEELSAAIETAKADPKFQKKMAQLKESQQESKPAPQTDTTTKTPVVNAGGMALKTPVGSQPDHAVTTSKNFTKKAK